MSHAEKEAKRILSVNPALRPGALNRSVNERLSAAGAAGLAIALDVNAEIVTEIRVRCDTKHVPAPWDRSAA